MSVRIFIKFRTRQIPCEPDKKLKHVADAACSTLLGRTFDHQKDFLHSQGEIDHIDALCHIVIDCEYHNSSSAPEEVMLYCYAVESSQSDNHRL